MTMSNSIELATEFPRSARAVVDATAGPVVVAPVPRELLRLTQGLYGVFWGMMATVFATTQLMMPQFGMAAASWVLIAGALATLAGALRLRLTRLHPDSDPGAQSRWKQRTTCLAGLSVLMTYFGVIFLMWLQARSSLYLLTNTLLFLLALIGVVVALNFVVLSLAPVLSRQTLVLEARVFAGANIALILLPILCTAGYIALVSVARPAHPLHVSHEVVSRFMLHSNLWVVTAMLLPLSLTLAMVWAAKDSALRVMIRLMSEAGPARDQRGESAS